MNPATLTCIVVDDEQYAIDVLEHFIKDTPGLSLLKTFTHSPEALAWALNNPVQLVFLDISMPKLNGIEFAKQVKGRTMVILCSAHSEYGVESYNHNVIDYLLKPVEYPRFLSAIQKVKEQYGKTVAAPEMEFIMLSAEGRNRMVKVDYDDIYYIVSAKNYLYFHLRDQAIKTIMTFKEAEIKLPRNRFLRVHNSYMIAVDKIKHLDNYNITLQLPETAIPIGPSYRDVVFEQLNFKA
jgi:two-component system, LytTR family, response regulator